MFKIIFCQVTAILFSLEAGCTPKITSNRHETGSSDRQLLFNVRGFAEVTIGEIMTAAALTHGGCYRHFTSKQEFYAEAVRHFLQYEAPASWQKNAPASHRKRDQLSPGPWLTPTCRTNTWTDVDGSCPLIGLSSDELSGEAVKAAYREVAESMIQVFKANMKGRTAREQAMVLVALCVRGMVLARALDDQVLAHDFLGTARKHVQKATGWGDRRAH